MLITLSDTYDKNRNHLIDMLRFLAAAGVALYHFQRISPFAGNWYRYGCSFGKLGVPVFFIISGFCIRLAQLHVTTPGEFLIRRLFRIFPPYWFSLSLVLACVLVLRLITGFNSVTLLPKTPVSILATIFLATSPLTKYSTINWVYWTLTCELFFYLLVGLSMFARNNLRFIGLLIIIIFSLFLPYHATGILFFFSELPTFMMGYALSLFVLSGEYRKQASLLGLLSVAGVILKHSELAYLLTCLLSVLLIWAGYKKPIGPNLLSRLGDYSYSIYLIHVPVCMYLLGFVRKSKLLQDNVWANILADLFLLSSVIFLSSFIFRWIEKPAIDLGKKLSRKFKPANRV